MVEKSHTAPFRQGADWWPTYADPFRHMGTKFAEYYSPAADASSTEAYYEINIELPGVAEADVDITLNDHTLIVKGEKKPATLSEEHKLYFDERHYGAFERSFRLPEDTNPDNVAAELKNGVLSIKVQKSAPEAKERKIKIKGL